MLVQVADSHEADMIVAILGYLLTFVKTPFHGAYYHRIKSMYLTRSILKDNRIFNNKLSHKHSQLSLSSKLTSIDNSNIML